MFTGIFLPDQRLLLSATQGRATPRAAWKARAMGQQLCILLPGERSMPTPYLGEGMGLEALKPPPERLPASGAGGRKCWEGDGHRSYEGSSWAARVLATSLFYRRKKGLGSLSIGNTFRPCRGEEERRGAGQAWLTLYRGSPAVPMRRG